MKIGDYIKALRHQQGLTLEELASALNTFQNDIFFNKGKLSKWERNTDEPRLSALKVLADYYKVPIDEVLGETIETAESSIKPYIRVKIFGTVPAGIPIEAIEDVVDYEEISFEESFFKKDKSYIGLRVKGDSMYPKYLDGDNIIVELDPHPESGSDCVVYVNGYNATLKKVEYDRKIGEDNTIIGKVTLIPLNPSYPPTTYSDGDDPVTILGKVVQLRRNI